ncbi:hypothetical protein D9M70_591010 [compost metagenome]
MADDFCCVPCAWLAPRGLAVLAGHGVAVCRNRACVVDRIEEVRRAELDARSRDSATRDLAIYAALEISARVNVEQVAAAAIAALHLHGPLPERITCQNRRWDEQEHQNRKRSSHFLSNFRQNI